jgi:penicillin-binding protein 1A
LREIVTTGHSAPIRATKIVAAGKTGTSSRTSDVWFIGFTSRWMATAWIGDDLYQRQLGYKDASFMLSVPMWARFMAAVVGEQPLEEIPWERPPGVKPNDTGGPLKKGFPPPPATLPPDETTAAPSVPAAPPTTPSPAPPTGLLKLKTIRVPGAPVRPLRPGEAPRVALPGNAAPPRR